MCRSGTHLQRAWTNSKTMYLPGPTGILRPVPSSLWLLEYKIHAKSAIDDFFPQQPLNFVHFECKHYILLGLIGESHNGCDWHWPFGPHPRCR